jgi:hypothetical protein
LLQDIPDFGPTTRQPYKSLEISATGDKRKSKPKIPQHLKMATATEVNTKNIEVMINIIKK